jgi:hypothetical protein
MHLVRVKTFQSEKKADCLKRVAASIHEIAQEDVVEVLDILLLASLMGSSVKSEETH